MQELLSFLSTQAASILGAQDRREAVITACEKFFDQVIAPVDLPGPDPIIDPLLRATIRPVVGKLYDEVAKELEGLTRA
jgi:hypothetical protein